MKDSLLTFVKTITFYTVKLYFVSMRFGKHSYNNFQN